MHTARTNPERILALVLVLVLAVAGSALVMMLFGMQARLIPYSALAALGFLFVLQLCGNQRLLLLIGLIMAAPISLSLNFMTVVHIGGSMSYSIDLVDFFVVLLLGFQVRDLFWGDQKHYVLPTITWWWVVLIVLGLISVAAGPIRHLPGFEVLRMVKNLLFFLVLVNELRRIRQFEYVFFALGAGVLIQVLASFIQFLLKSDLGLQALGEAAPVSTVAANLGVYAQSSGVYRVGALMGHPNLLSTYLALLMPLLISLLFTRYSALIKSGLGILLVLASFSLLLTLSRSGWLSFAVAVLVLMSFLFLEGGLRKRYLVLKGFLLIGGLIVGLAVSGPVIQRITQSDSGAVDFRFDWMVVAAKMIAERPLFGFGLNQFVYDMVPYTPQGSISALIDTFGEGIPAVHNIYLLVWAEQGTIAFVAFMLFHVHLLKLAYLNLRYRIDERMHAANIGAACGVVALLIDGMASFYIKVPACARTFWIVAAIIVSVNYWNKNNYRLRQALAVARTSSHAPGRLGLATT